MADTVSTNLLFPKKLSENTRSLRLQFLNVSDGTGETEVIKVKKSGLSHLSGAPCVALTIMSIDWFVDGMRVDVYFDHATDIKIATLTGHGYIDFEPYGGLTDPAYDGTGDIIFTTSNHSSGDSYMIILNVRVEYENKN